MRPVERGMSPQAFSNYRDAYPYLVERMGDYCSYCERQIETHLAVEHVQPKDPVPALVNSWTNFLLGCVHCNSCKGATQVSVMDYLWPDTDNTLRAFEYGPGGSISSNPTLVPAIRAKADAMITLTGLDKDPGNPAPDRRPTESDKRWLKRKEAWDKAARCRDILALQDTAETRELIVDVAKGKGMFTIYWVQFSHDADMRKRFREAFVGTAPNCFDNAENAQPRLGGQI
jgi:uncharacterized protein (TIGR02646 family)